MRDENNTPYQAKEKAGCIGITISFLFPIIGLIIYYVKRDSVSNHSVSNPKAYLYAALLMILIGTLIGTFA